MIATKTPILLKRRLLSLVRYSTLPVGEKWTLNELATEFAEKLRSSTLQSIPNSNIKLLSLSTVRWFRRFETLSVGNQEYFHLVMRPHAIDLWESILEEEKWNKFAVIGSPGIGKSIGLYYLLKRLLERNSTVVLEKRKSGLSFAFLPVQGNEGVLRYNVYKSSYESYYSELLEDPNTWYLIDPPKAESWSGPPVVEAKTVLAASPDPNHLGEWKKSEDFTQLYMKPWDLDELKAGGQYLCDNQKILMDLEKRYYYVGGIPRHLFNDQHYETALKQQNAVDYKAIESAFLRDDYTEIQDKSKPTSALFSFKPIESKEEWKRNGLSSEFIKYSRYTLEFVSQHAAEIVASQHLKKLMSAIECRNVEDGIAMGSKYEKCAILLLQKGGTFRSFKLETPENKAIKPVQTNPSHVKFEKLRRRRKRRRRSFMTAFL